MILAKYITQGDRGSHKAVSDNSGHTAFTLIWFGPYSAASPFVAFATAPFDALYHTKPGRGRVAPMLAILMMEPPDPCLMMVGTVAPIEWKMDLTLTFITRRNSASVTSSVGF